MNVKKTMMAGLMGMAVLVPVKAQNVRILSETGVTGDINKELLYSGGLHAEISSSKNTADFYGGMLVDSEKQFTFESQFENEYSWTENLSSWIRETFHLSKRENNLTSEVAPIKVNKSFNKFDTSLAPVYIMQNDFKEHENTQGVGMVLSTIYNVDSDNALKFEAEYSTEPAKNLFETRFGKLKDSISYVISYLRKF